VTIDQPRVTPTVQIGMDPWAATGSQSRVAANAAVCVPKGAVTRDWPSRLHGVRVRAIHCLGR